MHVIIIRAAVHFEHFKRGRIAVKRVRRGKFFVFPFVKHVIRVALSVRFDAPFRAVNRIVQTIVMVPSYSKGDPDIPDEVYARVRAQYLEEEEKKRKAREEKK